MISGPALSPNEDQLQQYLRMASQLIHDISDQDLDFEDDEISNILQEPIKQQMIEHQTSKQNCSQQPFRFSDIVRSPLQFINKSTSRSQLFKLIILLKQQNEHLQANVKNCLQTDNFAIKIPQNNNNNMQLSIEQKQYITSNTAKQFIEDQQIQIFQKTIRDLNTKLDEQREKANLLRQQQKIIIKNIGMLKKNWEQLCGNLYRIEKKKIAIIDATNRENRKVKNELQVQKLLSDYLDTFNQNVSSQNQDHALFKKSMKFSKMAIQSNVEIIQGQQFSDQASLSQQGSLSPFPELDTPQIKNRYFIKKFQQNRESQKPKRKERTKVQENQNSKDISMSILDEINLTKRSKKPKREEDALFSRHRRKKHKSPF